MMSWVGDPLLIGANEMGLPETQRTFFSLGLAGLVLFGWIVSWDLGQISGAHPGSNHDLGDKLRWSSPWEPNIIKFLAIGLITFPSPFIGWPSPIIMVR